MTNDVTKMSKPMNEEEMIDTLKGLVFGTFDRTTAKEREALDMAIKALEQQPITWIVGKDNCQVAVRNMPIDKMQKICAIIGEEEQQPCEDAISRKRLIILIDEGAELHPYKVVGDSETYSNYNQGWTDAFDWLYANIDCDNLPSVKPQPKIDEIISRIEEARDKDQIAEYPYNRCIKIIREVLGDD